MQEILMQMARGMGITGTTKDWVISVVVVCYGITLTISLLLLNCFDKKILSERDRERDRYVARGIIKASWLFIGAYILLSTAVWLKI
ncbi:hypothetical protein CN495_08700 [Bacillus thuringiensis]|uniref:Uncharacterized protein n=1 Tax=Bacillus thuringiensis TaxID=1428 RepID=A0ABD6S9V1_BACTU|nr:hypothetical protein CN495_08700 [Bacillus thuringiensis]